MSVRGFIIAIENYSQIEQGFSSNLDGTVKSGQAFREWLIKTKKVKPSDIVFCTDLDVPERTADATSAGVKSELLRIGKEGKDRTEQLYFFFCGHGFTFVDQGGKQQSSVMVCSDFVNYQVSGGSCLKLDEVQWFLRGMLGRQQDDHYYFIDACRTELTAKEIDVAGLGIILADQSSLGDPSEFILYSTRPGALAAVASAFPEALIDGLNGMGRAKIWREGDSEAMVVVFRNLVNYVKLRIQGQVVTSKTTGERDGEIQTLIPAPLFKCSIVVENGENSELFEYELRVGPERALLDKQEFSGASHQLPPRKAQDYYLTVRDAIAPCTNLDPLPISLYEDRVARFRKGGPADPAPKPLPDPDPPAALTVELPPNTTAVVRNTLTGHDTEVSSLTPSSLPAGDYTVRVLELSTNTPVERREFALEAGKPESLNLAKFKESPLRDAILGAVPGNHHAGSVDFAETLGPMADQDLGLWLALIGASRILGEKGYYEKLSNLPLKWLDQLPADRSAVYFLSAFDNPDTQVCLGMTWGGKTEWFQPERIESLPGLFEYELSQKSLEGFYPEEARQPLLSFFIPGQQPATIASCLSPNRVTFITLTTDENSQMQIGQFLLPPRHLWDRLRPNVAGALYSPGKLQSIKAYAQAQRLFRQRRSLHLDAPSDELRKLLYLKWIDPVTAIMAAYELIRRNNRTLLDEVSNNLRKYFPECPDTHAIERLVTGEGSTHKVPIFLDGFRAFPRLFENLPLPQNKLDFQSPWTLWRGATRSPDF